MSSTYLISPAGHPNYGDELIAAAWLRHLATSRPEDEVWLDCPNPGLATELFHGIHPGLRVTNTLWRACWEAPSDDPAVVMAHVAGLVTHLGSPAFDLGLERLRQVDTLHFLGGGYLNDLWPIHAGLVAGAVAAKALSGARLVGTGLSLVPILRSSADDGASSGAPFLDLLQTFDHLSVRDEPSAQAAGTTLGLDDAFLGVEEQLTRGLARGGADLMVCLQSDLQTPEHRARVIESVERTVSRARDEGRTIQYVEAIPGIDRPAYDALSHLIDPDCFVPFISVWREGIPLRPDQTWLTTRFHLHFLAAAAGASGTAIGVRDGFYDIKHQSLIALGSGWTYRDSSAGGDIALPDHAPAAARFTSERRTRADSKRREADALYPVRPGPSPDRRGLAPSRIAQSLRGVMARDRPAAS
ncbi:polysaccharide pyruvyl transferase family protein [Arthrobacter agilis]|uniref:polysaccharide pyruvyl transferase family protein n=1 Tax=Arthrobacter agilis TaxID=37921 RepID=UPI0023663B6D|nr:polysaccharide pyruvyl transferase family protein [Arthrobacter agilis]WDF33953.1 polysaccharide pyruvyl transferase family protein [Arthrobacter agilis]